MYKYVIPALLLASPLVVNAQSKAKKIKCTVANEEGKPMKGVTAIEHGTEDTLVTNAGGVFIITAAEPIQVALTARGYQDEHILVSPDVKCETRLRRDEDADMDNAEEEE